jgi:SAM-dependent methyltransferase
MGMKLLLHVGCGTKGMKIPFEFAAYKEVRLDKNKSVQPDIVADIVAMPMIDNESYDAVYCSHVLEHLFAHEVGHALREFKRVLKPQGTLHILVPDLQSIGGKLALDQADAIVYMSPIGPIAPLDVLYGLRASVAGGNHFMAHKTGFTQSVLKRHLDDAGFAGVKIERGDKDYAIKAWATNPAYAPEENSHASQEPEAESIPEREVRALVGEEASL